MKILLAIKTCYRYQDRAQSQRETWVPRLAQAVPEGWQVDLRFFLGRAKKIGDHRSPLQDEVFLDCDDSYRGLPEKTREIYRWARARDYDFVFACDDDVYIVPERLLAGEFVEHDYMGRLRGPSGPFPAPYASGFATWTSRRAVGILADAELKDHSMQDRWIGNVLYPAGIRCQRETRFVLTRSRRNTPCAREGARKNNDIIVACEFWPEEMRKEHAAFLNGSSSTPNPQSLIPDPSFSQTAIIIKTFLRDGFLFRTVRDIEKHLPGMKMVIVDDGLERSTKIRLYQELARRGHICEWMPFDSGFGAKSNRAIELIGDRVYTLIGSDDFNFAGPGVADGICKMIAVLDHDPEVGSVAGRVNGNRYEGFLIRGPDWVKEVLLDPEKDPFRLTTGGVKYYPVDLTVNYNLVQTKLLGPGRITWPEDSKIGGDHFGFYDQLREMGMKAAWIPGVSIHEQPPDATGLNDRRYPSYRGRARKAIPGFLRRHGLKWYQGFYGNIDRLPERSADNADRADSERANAHY